MARRPHNRRGFPTALSCLGLVALTPAHFSDGLGALSEPVLFLFTPVSHPVRQIAAALDRTPDPAADNGPLAQELRASLDVAHLEIARLRSDRNSLRKRMIELQRGVDLNPALDIRPLSAPVTGVSSDLTRGRITVGAGRQVGVRKGGVVAIHGGVHLVGRVISTTSHSCGVRPLTAPETGILDAVVTTQDSDRFWRCQLEPDDSGLLKGALESAANEVQAGMPVRLSDPHWPRAAQMFTLGYVEHVDTGPRGHRTVTVTPALRAAQLNHVVLLIPLLPSDAASRSVSTRGTAP